MTCDKCGAVLGPFQFNGMQQDTGKTFSYCEACFVSTFNQAELVADMKRRTRETNAPQIKAELERKIEQMKTAFGAKFADLQTREARFPREAYELVFASLLYAQMKDALFLRQTPCGKTVTGRELVEACQLYAAEQWGGAAKSQLASWGLKTSSDIGDLIYILIHNQMMRAKPEDNRSDFDGLPYFDEQSAI
jgi:uncharacterized repeat protein (TIGR04138 family)